MLRVKEGEGKPGVAAALFNKGDELRRLDRDEEEGGGGAPWTAEEDKKGEEEAAAEEEAADE